MRELSLDERKKILLEILKDIDAFCKKEKITYYLDSGTLLGAVRHKGFILWDDDIDIAMPRDDYERFRLLFNSEKCIVFSHKTKKDYYYQFVKVKYRRSSIIETDIPQIEGLGVNIDVFPLDGMPDNLILRRIHQDYLMLLNKVRALNVHLNDRAPSVLKFAFRWKWLIRRTDNSGKRFDMSKSKYCGNIVVTNVRHKEIPIKCFAGTEYLDFEDGKYPAPAGYDEYLRMLYGDYMKLPPKEKQVVCHNTRAFLYD